MPRRSDTRVDLAGLTVTDARTGSAVDPGSLAGVHLLVLLRHRH